MVALLCFCCDHCNPAGAKFCNACGTPLHLKPCKHCEAINTRAAAHCHQCGETFAFEFPTPLVAVAMPDPPDAVDGHVHAIEAPLQPPRPRGIRTRLAAVLLGLTATVMLSAYYAYRQPGSGLATGAMIEQPPARAPLEPMPRSAAAATPSPVLSDPAAPPASPGGAAGARDPAATVPAAGHAATGGSPTKPTAARVRAVSKASSAKPKLERVAPSSGAESFAAIPPVFEQDVGPRPLPEARLIAVQQMVAPSPPRIAAHPAPALKSREAPRRPAPPNGGWERPCAEGVALEHTCDVRLMPKGN